MNKTKTQELNGRHCDRISRYRKELGACQEALTKKDPNTEALIETLRRKVSTAYDVNFDHLRAARSSGNKRKYMSREKDLDEISKEIVRMSNIFGKKIRIIRLLKALHEHGTE